MQSILISRLYPLTITQVEENFFNKTDYPQYDVAYFRKKTKNKGRGKAAM